MKPVTLEVRHEAAAKAAVQIAVGTFGRLDVLVNNAGYGQFAPFEQMNAEDFQAVVDTCFCGVVYTTRAALPVMRKQRSGHIFQVSSVGGRMAIAGNTSYHAAKWAVGGFSDALAMEVAPFGLKVCTLEPGGIRTNWARRAGQNAPDLLPEYEASVGSILKLLRNLEGRSEGDPDKIADVIVQLANSDEVPLRLILGVDAEKRVHGAETGRASEAVMAGNAAQTSSEMPAKISFLRPVPSIARVTRGSSKALTDERSMISMPGSASTSSGNFGSDHRPENTRADGFFD